MDEVEKRGDTVNRDLESPPPPPGSASGETDRGKRIKQWLCDVAKVREEGAPIPEKPEGNLAYQSQKDAAVEKEEARGPPNPGLDTNRVLDQNDQDGPAPVEEPEQGTTDPLEGATAVLPQQCKPPVPIEAEVIIINQQPPSPPAPRMKTNEADLEGKAEEDSDCQIVEGPPEAAEPLRAKSPKIAPKVLWRLKKSKETSITLQLIPDKGREGSLPREEPPTPGPSPTMENPLQGIYGTKSPSRENDKNEKGEKQE